MKDINTFVLRGNSQRWVLLGAFCFASALGWADDKVTRVYVLKYADVSNISRVIDIAVRAPAGSRIIGGTGKRLVISDTADQQDTIAQLLPVLDQPVNATDPEKIQMKMLMNAAQFMRQQKIAAKPAPEAASAPAGSPALTSSANMAGGVQSYDKFTPAKPYKSIYASDDANLLKGPRIMVIEPVLLSLTSLQLKGIFKANTGSPLALLAYGSISYTAHDGGLFENNHDRVKDVTSTVLRDRVILVGPDHIPREIMFKSSL